MRDRFAEILRPDAESIDVRAKIVPPTGACLSRAAEYLGSDAELLKAPLPEGVAARVEGVMVGLHPVAKQVLARTRGVWFARNLHREAAVFLRCDVDRAAATGGFVLVDIGQFPLDQPLRDAEVPALYWRSLTGEPAVRSPYSVASLNAEAVTSPDHAMRYLVLHELGHALSLMSGEFDVDGRGRMQVATTSGFVGLSWRLLTTEGEQAGYAQGSRAVQAYVPSRTLDTWEWGNMLAVLSADAALLAPGYARRPPLSVAARRRAVCDLVEELPEAGFVTPTAARYPTEDFAEMFAHAILADEQKIRPEDVLTIDLPTCGRRSLGSPYFSRGVAAKRAYMERALGLDR